MTDKITIINRRGRTAPTIAADEFEEDPDDLAANKFVSVTGLQLAETTLVTVILLVVATVMRVGVADELASFDCT